MQPKASPTPTKGTDQPHSRGTDRNPTSGRQQTEWLRAQCQEAALLFAGTPHKVVIFRALGWKSSRFVNFQGFHFEPLFINFSYSVHPLRGSGFSLCFGAKSASMAL